MKRFFKGSVFGEHEILEYSEKNGELRYEYRKSIEVPTKAHSNVYQEYGSSGKIPKNVFLQGEKAVEKYVQQKIARDIKRQQKSIDAFDTFAKNPDFPVETEYDGKMLEGKIISADDSTLCVRLEEPYQGEAFVIYGFGSAMAGKHIFAGKKKFSNDAIASAQKLLCQIYDEKKNYKKHKNVIDMAERLNKESDTN